jgi:hypothetical protein
MRYLARKIGSETPITELTDAVLRELIASEKAESKLRRRQIKARTDEHRSRGGKSC